MTDTTHSHSSAQLPSHGFRSLEVARLIMERPHRHNDVELNFVEAGALTYLLGGATVEFEADNLYVFWAAMPHQIIHATPETAHRVLTIPLPDFLRLNLPAAMVRTLLNGRALIDGERNSAALNRLQFQRWHHYLRTGSHDCARIVLLEVEACLRRLAMAQAANPAPAASTGDTGGFNHVQTMVAFISDHYRDPLTVDLVAQAAGLHPNYAMQLFRKHVDMTLVEYLTQYRIAHAQRRLLTSDAPVIEVALACGFNSLSRFYAAFKTICGQTPSAYRQSVTRRGDLAEQQLVSLLMTLHRDVPTLGAAQNKPPTETS